MYLKNGACSWEEITLGLLRVIANGKDLHLRSTKEFESQPTSPDFMLLPAPPPCISWEQADAERDATWHDQHWKLTFPLSSYHFCVITMQWHFGFRCKWHLHFDMNFLVFPSQTLFIRISSQSGSDWPTPSCSVAHQPLNWLCSHGRGILAQVTWAGV